MVVPWHPEWQAAAPWGPTATRQTQTSRAWQPRGGADIVHKLRGRSFTEREKGASLVEFALIAPLLILLLLGIIEFGWLFGQYNDVRHGAREGARLASVDGGTNQEIADYVCDSMDLSNGGTLEVDLARTGNTIGATGMATVTLSVDSLSGAPFITTFLPSELESSVSFRLEQVPNWIEADDLTCTP